MAAGNLCGHPQWQAEKLPTMNGRPVLWAIRNSPSEKKISGEVKHVKKMKLLGPTTKRNFTIFFILLFSFSSTEFIRKRLYWPGCFFLRTLADFPVKSLTYNPLMLAYTHNITLEHCFVVRLIEFWDGVINGNLSK